jgi:hypothetical protein
VICVSYVYSEVATVGVFRQSLSGIIPSINERAASTATLIDMPKTDLATRNPTITVLQLS